MLVLNKINDRHERSGLIGYETGEREELCAYIDASVAESGIDVEALAAMGEVLASARRKAPAKRRSGTQRARKRGRAG